MRRCTSCRAPVRGKTCNGLAAAAFAFAVIHFATAAAFGVVGRALARPLFLFATAVAYEVPLDPHSVRDAYFLGQRNDEKTARFLDAYVKHLPPPEKGPDISEIQLLTPYAQVVELSRQKTVGYSAQQAEQDYRERGDRIRVRVRIEFTATYGLAEVRKTRPSGASPGIIMRSEDFWKDFKVGLSQNDQWIEPLDIYGEPTYSLFNPGATGPVMNGALVFVDFNAADVSSSTANVEVFTPDGQHVVATFDLEKLR